MCSYKAVKLPCRRAGGDADARALCVVCAFRRLVWRYW